MEKAHKTLQGLFAQFIGKSLRVPYEILSICEHQSTVKTILQMTEQMFELHQP